MNRSTPPAPDDDGTVATLEAALRSGLGSGPVDVQALAAGTRRGVRRALARRRATIGAAALVVAAVPLGYATVLDRTATTTAQVASASVPPVLEPTTSPTPPATTEPAATPTPDPTSPPAVLTTPVPTSTGVVAPPPAPTPSSSAVQTPLPADPNVTAYPIPDAVALTPADLPAGQKLGFDSKQYRYQPTAMQQSCQEDRPGARPVAGRQWGWYDERRLSETTAVDHVVTGWAPGTGRARFADLVRDRGLCRWLTPVTRVDSSGLPGTEAWAATTVSNRLTFGIAAVRIGDVVVAVTVMHPDGVRPAVTLAKDLVTVAAQRLADEGVGTR